MQRGFESTVNSVHRQTCRVRYIWTVCLSFFFFAIPVSAQEIKSTKRATPTSSVAALAPIRVGVLSEADDKTHIDVVTAFVDTLNNLTKPTFKQAFTLVPDAQFSVPTANPQASYNAAQTLTQRDDLQLILVAGHENGKQLLSANDTKAVFVALSNDTFPPQTTAVQTNAFNAKNVQIFPEQFWFARLLDLQRVVGLKRLGIILDKKTEQSATRVAQTLAQLQHTDVPFEYFVFELQSDATTEACREALDSLFFDEVDSLLFEGSRCFSADRNDLPEQLAVLQSRGMLPVSVADPEAVQRGALIAPSQDVYQKLAWELALNLRFNPVLTSSFANVFQVAVSPPQNFSGFMPYYTLNMSLAEVMNFAPSAALLAVTHTFIR